MKERVNISDLVELILIFLFSHDLSEQPHQAFKKLGE